MRIATWNINGLRARTDFVLHWLASRQPDVVGLQELKLEDEAFPHQAFAEVGYHAVAHGQKSWNGVAVLAREVPEVVQVGLPGQEDLGSRLITARVGGLSFTTIYVPNGKSVEHEDFGRKLLWLDALASHLAVAPGPDTVLCGDFNLCPGPLDSWAWEDRQGSIFHTAEEHQRHEVLLGLGLIDVFRVRNPDERSFSWWDYRAGAFHKKQGLRIDLILATEEVTSRVREVWIDRDYRKKQDGLTPSDHAPVIAELD